MTHLDPYMLYHGFFAYGIATGIFLAVFLFMLLFATFQYFINQRQHGGKLFFYNSIAILCYTLFSLFVIQSHFPFINEIVPKWLLFWGKVAVPLALYMNAKMLLKSIPAKSLRAFLFWDSTRLFYRMINAFYLLSFIALIFITKQHDAIILSLVLALINSTGSIFFLKQSFSFNQIGRFYLYSLISLSILLIILIIIFANFNLSSLHYLKHFFILAHISLSFVALLGSFLLSATIFKENRKIVDESELNVENFYKNIFYALKNEEFFLEYQPKVDLKNGAIRGVEALIRWKHGKRGMISPVTFIPLAEQSEVINHICRWVITQAIKDINVLMEKGLYIPVAINFSVKNININMVNFLQQQIELNKLPVNMITIEITESLFLDLSDEKKEALKRIHELGIKVSLDDFSAGFSSLQHLGEMGLDELKIDRALTSKVLEESKNAVVSTIMDMCHKLDIKVVAEGIDDDRVKKVFTLMDCEMAQGFGICRPKNLDDLVVWFDEYSLISHYH